MRMLLEWLVELFPSKWMRKTLESFVDDPVFNGHPAAIAPEPPAEPKAKASSRVDRRPLPSPPPRRAQAKQPEPIDLASRPTTTTSGKPRGRPAGCYHGPTSWIDAFRSCLSCRSILSLFVSVVVLVSVSFEVVMVVLFCSGFVSVVVIVLSLFGTLVSHPSPGMKTYMKRKVYTV